MACVWSLRNGVSSGKETREIEMNAEKPEEKDLYDYDVQPERKRTPESAKWSNDLAELCGLDPIPGDKGPGYDAKVDAPTPPLVA
jgi:hypothetical protein